MRSHRRNRRSLPATMTRNRQKKLFGPRPNDFLKGTARLADASKQFRQRLPCRLRLAPPACRSVRTNLERQVSACRLEAFDPARPARSQALVLFPAHLQPLFCDGSSLFSTRFIDDITVSIVFDTFDSPVGPSEPPVDS